MRNIAFCILAVLFLVTGSVTADAAKRKYTSDAEIQAEIQNKLEKAWRQRRIEGVNMVLSAMTVDTYVEAQGIAKWAYSRYQSPYERDPHIGMIYSNAMIEMARSYQSHRKRDAARDTMAVGAAAFVSSQIIAFENVARCADKSAGKEYVVDWMQGEPYKTYKNFLAAATPESRKKVWADAKAIADGRDTARPDKNLCATGAEAIAKSQMDQKCKKDLNCDLVQFVELVGDDVWKARRDQIQSVIKTRVEEGKI